MPRLRIPRLRATRFPMPLLFATRFCVTRLCAVFLTLAGLVAAGLAPARADSGTVGIQFFKGGWVIGGVFGEGVLNFRGQIYGLSVGGISYGFTFGGSMTSLQGRVRNIKRPSDIEGVYGAGSAGVAIIKGGQGVVLTNPNGAILELSGQQTGLILNIDLSGLVLTLKR